MFNLVSLNYYYQSPIMPIMPIMPIKPISLIKPISPIILFAMAKQYIYGS
ncbi:MAG: hypothetical protein J6W77_04860 [Prevotella sp.]|nr:hypothetical protein [Prevotella sp.]